MRHNEFLVITMKTKNNKTLYLKATRRDNIYEWTFDKEEAIWFEHYGQVETFAKSYFKTFDKWDTEIVSTNLI